MNNKSTKELVLSGFFIAFGIVLPILFHGLGSGSVFLPMHIPVLIAGFMLGLPYAILVGVLTPILSSVFTGMPPAFPVLPFMIFELGTYAAATSILYRKYHLNVYVSLVLAMVLGRIASGIVVWVLAHLFMAQLPGPMMFIAGAVSKGIPGIIIQLVFIPPIVLMLQRQKAINS